MVWHELYRYPLSPEDAFTRLLWSLDFLVFNATSMSTLGAQLCIDIHVSQMMKAKYIPLIFDIICQYSYTFEHIKNRCVFTNRHKVVSII